MGQKTFKTLDEQIAILQSKGLIIEDIEYVKSILLRENYFFLNGYRHLFIKNTRESIYLPNTNFRELYGLFYFDRQLRNILFKNILIVENNIKSIMSYNLSKNYGYKEKDYLNLKNFDNNHKKSKQVNDVIRKMKRQIRVNGKQHRATVHYYNNYGYVPLWVGVKVLSFGIVGELFSILKYEDQKKIADDLNLDDVNALEFYLPIIANYRNLCAHEDICFDHRTDKVINDTKYHSMLNIPKTDDEYIYGKNDLFSLIIMLKQLLLKDNFNLLINEINYELEYLSGKLSTIDISKVLDEMGFPLNFKEIVRMD